MPQSCINILLTTNESFAQHCAVCIKSIQLNNPATNINIVIASLDLTSQSQELLMSMANSNSIQIKIVHFDNKKLAALPQIGKYSKDIYLRLWVDELFEEFSPEKVLYLDADTIVVGSLQDLWAIELGDNLIAAVDIPDSTSHVRCHLPLEKGYFNSGVLLFNVPAWRNEKCLEKIIDFLHENKEIALNPDQDALNGLFHDRRITLDYIYNAISPFFRQSGFPSIAKEHLDRIRLEVKIVHFNGKARPWIYGCNHPYRNKYLSYLSQTPWKNNKVTGRSLIKVIKRAISQLLSMDTFVKLPKNKINGH